MKRDRLEAGRLRERISIEHKNLVDNGRGGRKHPEGQPEWLPIANDLPAEIVPLRGGEALELGVLRNAQLWRVTIRFRPDIDASQRIVWDGIEMNIRVAARSVDRAAIVMTCESGVPN